MYKTNSSSFLRPLWQLHYHECLPLKQKHRRQAQGSWATVLIAAQSVSLVLLMEATLHRCAERTHPAGGRAVIAVPLCSFVSEIVCKCLGSTLLNFCFLPPQHWSASGLQPHLCVRVCARASVPTVPACHKQPVRVLAPLSACMRAS